MDFTSEQIERYSRQIVLKEIGGIGQKKLLDSKITIIGCGGLGSPAAYYLTAAGIGSIKIVDFDVVELSNLHRQILHFNNDLNKKKTQSAYEKLHKLNPDVNIEVIKINDGWKNRSLFFVWLPLTNFTLEPDDL